MFYISPALKKISRFAVIGVMNTAVDFGVLNLELFLFPAHLNLAVLFNTISFSIAVTNSYFWNKYWTFEGKGEAHASEFFEFLVVSVIALGINDAVLYALTSTVKIATIKPTLLINGAKLVGTLVSMTWNFLGYRFIFRIND
ncbi:MAG: GtrA family protein [Patescibacteria group bacterium]|nr:GtrA family protein [Patescibacteria group bacterium]MDE2438640.1 GtrA family protein [Patescibacteria group bacterium]